LLPNNKGGMFRLLKEDGKKYLSEMVIHKVILNIKEGFILFNLGVINRIRINWKKHNFFQKEF
jgi:hypothetical protein